MTFEGQPEYNLYKLGISTRVDTLAEFVVSAATEDQAKEKLNRYCEEVPQLGLNPKEQFPWGVDLKPLDPLDEDFYRAIGSVFSGVELVRDRRPLPAPVKKRKQFDPNQGQLFRMDSRGMTNDYIDLTVEVKRHRLARLYDKMKNRSVSKPR